MQSTDIRRSFLEFFAARGHKIVPSAPLLPAPSLGLLFTNAGMNPFVPYFLGQESPHPRVADTQRCLRAGGKHNDLEDVGFDGYHHTFFEMLGNWSFGDYFKEEAIRWAWELLVHHWHFPKERLYVTIYHPARDEPGDFDQEAADIWKAVLKSDDLDPAQHILCFGSKENFWSMGDTGPCGPCSEIHIDLTPCGDTKGTLVNAGDPRCIEIWNLVFMQYNRREDASLSPLPQKCVDTGMGLERVAGLLASTQNISNIDRCQTLDVLPSNYDSDLFQGIFQKISEISGLSYGGTFAQNRQETLGEEESRDFAFRVIADHIRALCFGIADGIFPSNEGQGYVLRRILRRAALFGKKLRLPKKFLVSLIPVLVEQMKNVFPELEKNQEYITSVIASEESHFERTLDRGIELFEDYVHEAENGIFLGKHAFKLYDTYGFPLDLTQLLAEAKGLRVDVAGFEAHMQEQQIRARQGQKKVQILADRETQHLPHLKTDFVGYERSGKLKAKVCYICHQELKGSDIIVDRTPFYAEKGGQMGDRGSIIFQDKVWEVFDTTYAPEGQIVHHVHGNADDIPIGVEVELEVDGLRRLAIERHHTATHLLQAALRDVFGKHVQQAGSWVTDQKLRFDFTHFESISAEKIREIEEKIQSWILSNGSVRTFETDFDKVPEGCTALFGERYGDRVRVVEVPGISMELCGGCHVRALGEIGPFKILSESAVASGVRRIEAIAGEIAYKCFQEQVELLQGLSRKFSVKNEDLPQKIDQLCGQLSRLEAELKTHRQDKEKQVMESLCEQAEAYGGDSQLLCIYVDRCEPRELRTLAISLLRRLKNGIIFLLAAASDDQTYHTALALAPVWIERGFQAQQCLGKIVERWNGKCGGKHDLAMGGGISILLAPPQKILDICRSDTKSLFAGSEV
ncbi:MAG: alanine--tRNA ligase [Puniceicoccales bacterium]|jgi:alanyl-tRNA synthetase|nr:alanine--tRNA ligase [Puniceicoccales bacterium]